MQQAEQTVLTGIYTGWAFCSTTIYADSWLTESPANSVGK